MENPRIVGHVVSVNGFRVRVEILKETHSPSRATLDGVLTAVAINSYLTFSIGAGRSIIGIITDLEARESYDPTSGDELSLELLKARRSVTVQLLGTAEKSHGKWTFNPGITVLPTLDAPAEVGSPEVLGAAFEHPPKRNKPNNLETNDFDFALVLGWPTGQTNNQVKASYNDLFSRPLAVVGNTGSGKSYSVASLLQKAMHNETLGASTQNAPHVFILDINGEFASAFPSKESDKSRRPNCIYLDGKEFGIPLWLFDSQEICAWLSASEQTQEPVLKDWWSSAKNNKIAPSAGGVRTADSPLFIKKSDLSDFTKQGISHSDRIDSYLATLRLRLRSRLDDKRWTSFLNYDKGNTKFPDLKDWLQKFGFHTSSSARVSVIDLSMLSHEALPYACAVIGRILFEAREKLPADQRYENPWVIVLEEAHNYVRPAWRLEDRAQTLSRNAFERIAKEGRKFGLSLIVASQRPSEISPTIISQCANFISHRLQNPDDIEHFRRIIPIQARRLLDQVTVLASGEAIVFGSAFHIPARVQIEKPALPPRSQTAAPFYEWKKEKEEFPLTTVITNWGIHNNQPQADDK